MGMSSPWGRCRPLCMWSRSRGPPRPWPARVTLPVCTPQLAAPSWLRRGASQAQDVHSGRARAPVHREQRDPAAGERTEPALPHAGEETPLPLPPPRERSVAPSSTLLREHTCPVIYFSTCASLHPLGALWALAFWWNGLVSYRT